MVVAVQLDQVTVAGATTRLHVAGQGQPLLYLHGTDGFGWPVALDRLATRFQVYVPEHPGFGESALPDTMDTAQDLAIHYLDLIQTLGLSDVALVGHSIGGWIAAELASLCDHLLGRLVLVDAMGLRIEGEQRLDIFTLPPNEVARATYHDQAVAQAALAADAAPDRVRAAMRTRNMVARLGWNPYLANLALQRRLRRISVPTLVVWGVNDRIVPVTHAHVYGTAIPNARVALIEACGHIPSVEQPEELARVVETFLAGTGS